MGPRNFKSEFEHGVDDLAVSMRCHAAVLLTSCLAIELNAAAAASIQRDMRTLLRRAGEYVVAYHESLTALVADELYVQTLTAYGGNEPVERTLRSEVALVRGESDDGWFAIRDVLEVDGRRIEERSGIETLLKVPRTRLRAAAFASAASQTKYNLGNVYRTINVPTLPLMFLLPDNQRRFRFREVRSGTAPGAGEIVVSYEERERPTIIRTPGGRSIVSRGQVWIDPSSGQIRKTELGTNEPRDLKTLISVTYRYEPRLNLLVPVTMLESYVTPTEQIAATATYSNFRRFEADARIVRED